MENSILALMQFSKEHRWFGDFIKRTFDIVVSLVVLIVFAPFYGLVALAIKRETPGPVFYRGLRVGQRGRYFQILKFRTMYETQESYAGPRVTAQDDARITPLGHWLRDTKLNEFPQFWNVLKGDMSLVGPRPEDPTLAKTWPTKIAKEVLAVRPGITSPTSVLYRNEENILHAKDVMQKYLHELSPNKMRLDQLYVRYRSFWLDLDTIFWTALLLIPKIKAYSPPEQLLFVGPVTRLIKRYVMWFLWDALVAFLSFSAVGMLLRILGQTDMTWIRPFEMAIAFSLIHGTVGGFLGANRVNWAKATSWDAIRLAISWLITSGVAFTLFYYWNLITRFGLVLYSATSIFSLLGIVFVRYRSRLAIGLLSRVLSSQPDPQVIRERVLIVGSGRTAEHIAWLLDHPTYSKKFQVVGFIDDDLLSRGMKIYGVKVLGGMNDIARIVAQKDVGLVMLADHQMSLSKYHTLCGDLKNTLAKVVLVPDIFGSLNNLVKVSPRDKSRGDPDSIQCRYCLAGYSLHINIGEENDAQIVETQASVKQ